MNKEKKLFYFFNFLMKYIRYLKIRLMLFNLNFLLRYFLKICLINNKYMYFIFEKFNDRFELLFVILD